MAAVIVSHNVGVAAVVDKGERSIRSCSDLILMEGGIVLKIKHTVDQGKPYIYAGALILFFFW